MCPLRLVCVCCTCLHCTVATFRCSSCLAVFTVQAVATVYLDFPPCSSAAVLASGTLPGSNSMCTSMFRLSPAQPVADVWLSPPHPRLQASPSLLKNMSDFFSLSSTLSLSLSSSLHPHSRPLPYLEPAELLGWRDSQWKTSFVSSLHGGGVRTEVKSCRAELPGRLPKTLLIRRPTFSPVFCKMFLFFCSTYS